MPSWCLGLLGASTVPEMLTPVGVRGTEKLMSEISGEGGPLLLSTGKLCHGEQKSTRRPERGGPREEEAGKEVILPPASKAQAWSFACSPAFLTIQHYFFLRVLSTTFCSVYFQCALEKGAGGGMERGREKKNDSSRQCSASSGKACGGRA